MSGAEDRNAIMKEIKYLINYSTVYLKIQIIKEITQDQRIILQEA